jgi:hypothetical protein
LKKLVLGAVAAIACTLPTAAIAQSAGDLVLSYYLNERFLYPAEVQSVSGGTVTLLWDDGTTSEVAKSALRPFNWKAGTSVSCKWSDGKYYAARIARIGGDYRTLDIVWTQDNTTSRTKTNFCRSAG